MWNKVFLSLVLVFPAIVSAETYLCIPEASAGVRDKNAENITAQVYRTNDSKYIHSDESGSWVVKELGRDEPMFRCDSEYVCRGANLFYGMFQRQENGLFSIVGTYFGEDMQTADLVVSKGLCSKI